MMGAASTKNNSFTASFWACVEILVWQFTTVLNTVLQSYPLLFFACFYYVEIVNYVSSVGHV